MSTEVTHLGKKIGTLRNDKVFITYRSKEHLFRKYDGFGLSYKVLLDLRKQDCRQIVIIYDDGSEQVKYVTNPNNFMEHGTLHAFKRNDWQRVLPRKYFKKNGDVQVLLD